MSNVPSFETTACDEIVRVNRLLQSLSDRAEKAEQWRPRAEAAFVRAENAERELADELSGNAALRRDFGARDDETMREFVARLVRERDEAGWLPASACCKSCEGPLTCAKCTVKEHQSSLLNDHEVRLKVAEKDLGAVMRHMPDLNRQVGDHDARIKAMDTLVQAMGERVNDHERRLRAREGKPK